MYINELPVEINRELCRLLDIEDYWKELAGIWMNYSPYQVNYMEQTARSLARSPTDYFFEKLGEQIHTVEELFILLYKMKHMPALICLKPVVDIMLHSKIRKLSNCSKAKDWKTDVNDDFYNQNSQETDSRKLVILKEKSPSTQREGIKDEMMRKELAVPKINYEELRRATDNWATSNLLGRGGFGCVFKGEWKHLTVAVKRLRNNDGNKELIREMCLNQYRHDNILPLYGYSLEGQEACLVFQLMPGGSLEHRLKRTDDHPPLTWSQRYNIMHGVAKGLQFLHTMNSIPLIHGDIKPANILLDSCLMPRIGDFGLARKGAQGTYGDVNTHVKISTICGTRPYLPIEFLRDHSLSPAVDVFSYGVVMLEVVTALAAFDKSRPKQRLTTYIRQLFNQGLDMATLEDPVLHNTAQSNPAMCRSFIAIGVHCTESKTHHRPTMLDVYQKLCDIKVPANNAYDTWAEQNQEY